MLRATIGGVGRTSHCQVKWKDLDNSDIPSLSSRVCQLIFCPFATLSKQLAPKPNVLAEPATSDCFDYTGLDTGERSEQEGLWGQNAAP